MCLQKVGCNTQEGAGRERNCTADLVGKSKAAMPLGGRGSNSKDVTEVLQRHLQHVPQPHANILCVAIGAASTVLDVDITMAAVHCRHKLPCMTCVYRMRSTGLH